MPSTYYLFDVASSNISQADVKETAANASIVAFQGYFPVRIPSNIVLNGFPPATFSSLISSKIQALISYYGAFVGVEYDDMIDNPSIDMAATTGVQVGSRGSVLLQVNGVVTTTMANLSGTPSEVVFTWEVYRVNYSDPKDGTLSKTLQEESAFDFTVELSFDNGSTFNTVTDGVLFSIPVPSQGSQFIARFTNDNSGIPEYLGFWTLLY